MQGFVLRDIWGLPRALAAGRAQQHGSNAIQIRFTEAPELASVLPHWTLNAFFSKTTKPSKFHIELELELELIHTQMTQKPVLRAEVYARALRASQIVNRKCVEAR
jgi:hypothetical protein